MTIFYKLHFLLTQSWQIKSSSSQKILLINIDMPINISLLSTPKALSNNSDLIDNKENTAANNFLVTKIQESLNPYYDHAALVHLKNQIMKKVSQERENYIREIKRNSPGAYQVISSLRSQIENLQSEVYFLRDELKEESTLIKSLIARFTLTIEHKEHKAKKFTNKSTIDDKNSINSKETSKTNNNITSKNVPVIDSIDFHVNNLATENDTPESTNHFLLPFLYEDEHLTRQATTNSTTINSTNNVNANKNTVNDTNNVLTP